ncbi:MAG: class I SAM-dependent methyltransferase, partial [Verrucomicrobia bacterium]|nr:class I SAM-dependent methyltransferase [Verrucomicrobiota bacterium]
MLRKINHHETSKARMIANARAVLAALPNSNWFKRAEADLYLDHENLGDSGVFDLLLHPQDRAYTIEELFAWLADDNGLHIELTDVARGSAAYRPELMVAAPHQKTMAALTGNLPLRQRFAVAEELSGNLIHHTFYATRGVKRRAPYGDPDFVPFLFHEPVTGADLATLIRRNNSRPFVLNHAHTAISTLINPGNFGAAILDQLDGQKCFGEIFAQVRNASSNAPAAAFIALSTSAA